jgi:hypothetical protein
VQGDELRSEALELLLQGHRGVAGHEQLDLVFRDAAADVAVGLPEIGLAVADDLRGRRVEFVASGA